VDCSVVTGTLEEEAIGSVDRANW